MLTVTEGLIIPHIIADCPSFGQANMASYEINLWGKNEKNNVLTLF
jgi:hypothetical protein